VTSDAPTTTAAVMAEYLAASGITKIFGYPGTSNIELMESARTRGVETVLARQESAAAFMAEGYAMSTGTPGVCMSTLGPGSTAMVGGVAAATLDRVPVIAISGQISTAREPYFTHQVVDHNRLYAPITKMAVRIDPGSVGTTMRKALRTATAERPGAVHLTTNADVARAEPIDADVVLPPMESGGVGLQVFRTVPGSDPLQGVRTSRQPLILAGVGAVRAQATDELIAMSEHLEAPVVVAPMSKGVFPEDHPNFAGVLDMACNDVVWGLLGEADLIIAAGFDAVELIKPWQVTAPVLHIDALPNTDQIYTADVELVGHIGSTLAWVRQETDGGSAWGRAAIDAHRTRLRDGYLAGRVSDRLNPTDVVDVLRAAMPRETIVTTDVGSHKLLVGQGWTTYLPRTSLMSNGLSSMGFSLPASIGAKLANPDAPVLCTVGDGGFAMVPGELQLASTLGIGITVVVFVDKSLNRIELKQQALGYPSTATTIDASDLVAMSTAMGGDGVRVDDIAGLEKAVAEPAPTDRPLLIEAHIDPAQYQSQF
jgi:acetolactate synthase I/II/III large subunit